MRISTFQADLWLSPVKTTENDPTLWKKNIKWRHYYVYEASQLARVIHSSYTTKVKNDGLDPFIATATPTMLLYFNGI